MSSSWICINSFQPNSFNLSLREIFTIAAITMSAAPPCIGVLMALRFHIPTNFLSFVLKKRSNLRTRPRSVCVFLSFYAVFCFYSCHFLTSGRSLNQHFMTYSAYFFEQFQSAANPTADFPYAIEKLTVLAFFLSAAYLSLRSGTGGSPFDLSHSSKILPYSISFLM